MLTTLENLENSGNFLILENPGKTQGILHLLKTAGNFGECDCGHRVLCLIVSNSCIDWLGGTVYGVRVEPVTVTMLLK